MCVCSYLVLESGRRVTSSPRTLTAGMIQTLANRSKVLSPTSMVSITTGMDQRMDYLATLLLVSVLNAKDGEVLRIELKMSFDE